jgi:multiple sugar transport system ATP-binding protein
MVFQNYALYPHMTVSRNIGFALKLRKTPRPEIESRVSATAAILGLQDHLTRLPGQLSGGQRQRVAMGRAIVREPAIFLMDEPLSNLDSKLRVQMRAEISRIQRLLGVTTIYVTHDQTEAMTLGDRVAVLQGGVLQQCDTPQALYDRPANLFVAAFIGSPSMNLYEATLAEGAVRIGTNAIPVPRELLREHPRLASLDDRTVIVGARPEHLQPAAPGAQHLRGKVHLVEALGSELLVHFTLDARRVEPDEALDDDLRDLASGTLDVAGSGIARVDPAFQANADEPLYLTVEPRHLRFFDAVSGAAL